MAAVAFAAQAVAVLGTEPRTHQVSAPLFLLLVAALQCEIDDLPCDLALVQLTAQSPIGQCPQCSALLHPFPGEGLVIDQTGPIHPRHDLVNYGRRNLPVGQALAHLPGRAAPHRQQSHQVAALADHRLVPLRSGRVVGCGGLLEDLLSARGQMLSYRIGTGDLMVTGADVGRV